MKVERRQPVSWEEAPLLDAVFGSERKAPGSSRRRPALALGLLVAVAAHAALYLAARAKEPSLETWAANVAALVHADLADSAPTEIDSTPVPRPEEPIEPELPEENLTPEPAPPEPQPHEAPASEPAPPPSQRSASDEPEQAADQPASPAQAGEVVAAPSEDGPVDLTDNTFVTGSASAYVGGATTNTGTGKTALNRSEVTKGGTGDAAAKSGTRTPSGPSKARSVQLPSGQWRCAWPKTALDQDIYEQYVVLRVRVRADGSVQDVKLQHDPGNGFGAAAIACAKSTRFSPALDDAGNPIAATSPPIRVRFTR